MVPPVVVSGIFGGYDAVKPLPPGVAGFLFTNDVEMFDAIRYGGWQPRLFRGVDGEHPRLTAKVPKFCGHLLLPEHPVQLWVDASLRLTPQVVEAFDHLAAFTAFPHPQRDNVTEEARVSERMTKYHGLPVVRQAAHYGDGRGLWASGFILRDFRIPAVCAMAERWLGENRRWTYQDQLSLPLVREWAGVEITPFPHNLWRNPWFDYEGHLRDD